MRRTAFRKLVCLALALTGVRVLAEDDIGPAGGHPKPGNQRSLADLLDKDDLPPLPPPRPVIAEPEPEPFPDSEPQPDRPGPRPVMERPPAPVVAGGGAADLQNAIAERNRIVDRSQLFDKFRQLQVEQPKLDQLRRAADNAARQANALAANARMLAMGDQVPQAAKAAAEAQARQAANAANALRQNWLQQRNVVQGLLRQVEPHVQPWLDCYRKMRRAYVPDRRDPNRQAVLRVVEGAIDGRKDLVEGRVLAGLLQAYEGNAAAADAHLDEACKLIAQHDLLLTALAADCCHAYLLLGTPDAVVEFIDMIENLNPQRQTAMRCWLVGINDMISGKDNEAGTFFQKALAKVNVFMPDKEVPPEAAPLLGDGAFFRLTAANTAQRNAKKAREILVRTKPDWDAWQLLRARAALAADEGKWDEAVAQVDRCLESCPGTIKDEVQGQRAAYVGRQPWIRPKPVKVAAR